MDYSKNNILDYKYDDLKILSDSFFDIDKNSNVSVKKELENIFNTDEIKKLSDSAKNIYLVLGETIRDNSDLKEKFIDLRDNYTSILKILNGKVKKFEMPDNEYNKLKQNDKAIVDQALKIKKASVFFEHANINFEQHLDEKLKSLYELIINKEIEFKIDKIKIKNNKSQKGEGNINEVLFTDDKKWVIKKDKFFITKGKAGAVHRQNKETGVYGHFATNGQQFVADSVSRQMGQQDIAQALGLDCIVKTKVALLENENGEKETVTVMENASLRAEDDLEVYQGAEVFLCTSKEELEDANKFLEEAKIKKLKPEIGVLGNYYHPKLVTPKMLADISAIGAMDFICGQVDRHSGNLFMHFKKNGDVKFKLIDNDRCFVISFTDADYKKWLKEKVPVVTTSLALRVMMLAKDYKEKTEKNLAGHIGKAGGSKDALSKKSKALLETEKRMVMLYNYIYKANFLKIDDICSDAKQKYEQVNEIYKQTDNNKDFSLDCLDNDIGKWQNTFKLDINSYKNDQRLGQFFKNVNKKLCKSENNILNDCNIKNDLGRYANKFLNITPKFSLLSPSTWIPSLVSKIELLKVVVFQKKANIFSATSFKTRKYLMEKWTPKTDKQLIKNKDIYKSIFDQVKNNIQDLSDSKTMQKDKDNDINKNNQTEEQANIIKNKKGNSKLPVKLSGLKRRNTIGPLGLLNKSKNEKNKNQNKNKNQDDEFNRS